MDTQNPILFWAAVAAMASLGSALVAAVYTFLTYRLVRLQSDPKVIVFVKHDTERPTLLLIRIENIGRDVARDVSFTPSRAIPARAWGLDVAAAKDSDAMTDGPLINGISALGPGDYREIAWGQYGGLEKALNGAKPILLEYSYRSDRSKFTGTAVLEIQSFLGTDASQAPILRIANTAEKIAATAEGLRREFAKSRQPEKSPQPQLPAEPPPSQQPPSP